ncbi:hypothetical protein OBBRIDRAFT_830511 [Obba rivulosa]|uniref:Uncharacterized protein n=1 Tax=Obba rivulosa TaxID=1052685 RepID=A0A8E2J6H6_9APHY|nr:hypothetical protein OBBRIDRAFT_830511 [Obba rivulosa]
MPGLVQRYNISAEHAKLLSTRPSHQRTSHARSPSAARPLAAARAEATSWYAAAVPPLADVQTALRRGRRDPDASQARAFRFYAPLVVFGVLFAIAVLALDPHSIAHRVLARRQGQGRAAELVLCVGTVMGAVGAALLVLRMIIWSVAEIAEMVVEAEAGQRAGGKGNTVELPSSNVLLGMYARDIENAVPTNRHTLFVENRQGNAKASLTS